MTSRATSRMVVVSIATIVVAGILVPSGAQASGSGRPDSLASSTAAMPALAPPGIGDSAPYVDEAGRVVARSHKDLESAVPQASLSSCQPISLPDNPHYSAGDVSGHGLWEKGTCTASTATVWNCLYEFYDDNTWRRKACSARVQLKPKSVSNNRSTARRACDATNEAISWRNHVDVDVDGQSDPSDQPYRQATVSCTVTGPDQ